MSSIRYGSGIQKNSQTEPAFRNLVSLNALFNESLRKAQASYALPDLIARCEPLPLVDVPAEDMLRLFDNLIGTIFNTPPNGNKLFLYIDVEKNKSKVKSEPRQFENFTIRFHTNLTSGESWKETNAIALSRASEIISRHNWIFGVNNIFQTGCLFTITVEGKFE